MSESYNYLQPNDNRYQALAAGTLREHDNWQNEAGHIADQIPFEGLRSAIQSWAAVSRETSVENLTASTGAVANRLKQAAEDASYKSASASALTDEDIKRGTIIVGNVQVGLRPNYRSYESFSQEIEQKTTANNRPSQEDARCAYDQVLDEGVAAFRMNLMYFYGQWQEAAETASPENIAKRVSGTLIDQHGKYFRDKLKTLLPYAEAEWRISGDSQLRYRLGRIASFGLAYRDDMNRKKNLQAAIKALSDQPEHPFNADLEAAIERELQAQKIIPKEERGTVARLYYQTTEQINIRFNQVLDVLTQTPGKPTPQSVRARAEQMVADGMSAKKVMRALSMEFHPDLHKDIDPELYKEVALWYEQKTNPQS